MTGGPQQRNRYRLMKTASDDILDEFQEPLLFTLQRFIAGITTTRRESLQQPPSKPHIKSRKRLRRLIHEPGDLIVQGERTDPSLVDCASGIHEPVNPHGFIVDRLRVWMADERGLRDLAGSEQERAERDRRRGFEPAVSSWCE